MTLSNFWGPLQFERVFKELLPELKKAWHRRQHRPLPESVQFTRNRPRVLRHHSGFSIRLSRG